MLSISEADAIEGIASGLLVKYGTTFPVRPGDMIQDEGHSVHWKAFKKRIDSYSILDPEEGTAIIFINEKLREFHPRLRFTMAHELGHILLKNHNIRNDEKAADEFAACLLMPTEEFNCTWGKERAERFGVSEAAVRMRQLMLLDRTAHRLQPEKWRPLDWRNNQEIVQTFQKAIKIISQPKYTNFFEREYDLSVGFSFPII